MANRVLPNRDEVVGELDGDTEAGEAIIEAYASRRLKTEAEWREAIDYEAAGKYLSTLIYDSDPDNTTRNEFMEYAMQEGRRIVAAAIGDTDDE